MPTKLRHAIKMSGNTVSYIGALGSPSDMKTDEAARDISDLVNNTIKTESLLSPLFLTGLWALEYNPL